MQVSTTTGATTEFSFIPSKPTLCKIAKIGAAVLLSTATTAAIGLYFALTPVSIFITATATAITCLAVVVFATRQKPNSKIPQQTDKQTSGQQNENEQQKKSSDGPQPRKEAPLTTLTPALSPSSSSTPPLSPSLYSINTPPLSPSFYSSSTPPLSPVVSPERTDFWLEPTFDTTFDALDMPTPSATPQQIPTPTPEVRQSFDFQNYLNTKQQPEQDAQKSSSNKQFQDHLKNNELRKAALLITNSFPNPYALDKPLLKMYIEAIIVELNTNSGQTIETLHSLAKQIQHPRLKEKIFAKLVKYYTEKNELKNVLKLIYLLPSGQKRSLCMNKLAEKHIDNNNYDMALEVLQQPRQWYPEADATALKLANCYFQRYRTSSDQDTRSSLISKALTALQSINAASEEKDDLSSKIATAFLSMNDMENTLTALSLIGYFRGAEKTLLDIRFSDLSRKCLENKNFSIAEQAIDKISDSNLKDTLLGEFADCTDDTVSKLEILYKISDKIVKNDKLNQLVGSFLDELEKTIGSISKNDNVALARKLTYAAHIIDKISAGDIRDPLLERLSTLYEKTKNSNFAYFAGADINAFRLLLKISNDQTRSDRVTAFLKKWNAPERTLNVAFDEIKNKAEQIPMDNELLALANAYLTSASSSLNTTFAVKHIHHTTLPEVLGAIQGNLIGKKDLILTLCRDSGVRKHEMLFHKLLKEVVRSSLIDTAKEKNEKLKFTPVQIDYINKNLVEQIVQQLKFLSTDSDADIIESAIAEATTEVNRNKLKQVLIFAGC